MKIFYKTMFALALSIIFVACSKDSESLQQQDELGVDFNKTSDTRIKGNFNYYKANQKIIQDYEQNRPKMPLDQGTVNYYLDLVGYNGSMNATEANKIADEVVIGMDLGMQKWLNEKTSFSMFTKTTVMQISNEGSIENISELQGFYDLPRNEQDILLGINSIADSYFAGFKSAGNTNRQVDPNEWAFHGAVYGFAAGYGLCGPPCGVLGAIVGGAVGYVVGWIANGFEK